MINGPIRKPTFSCACFPLLISSRVLLRVVEAVAFVPKRVLIWSALGLGWQCTLLTSFCPRSAFVPVLARLLAGPLSSAAGCPLLVPACCPPGRGASKDGVGKSL
jgi:hypothetical protein